MMSEKRIREIAAKMWVAFNKQDFPKLSVGDFDHATGREKWLAAARVAVSELQRCPKAKDRQRAAEPRVCRIGPGGKRTCK